MTAAAPRTGEGAERPVTPCPEPIDWDGHNCARCGASYHCGKCGCGSSMIGHRDRCPAPPLVRRPASSGDGGAPTRDARPRRSRPRIRQAGEWWLVLDEDGEAEAWYPTEAEAKAFAEGGGALTEDRPQELTWPSRHDSGVYFGDIEPTAPSPVPEEGPPTETPFDYLRRAVSLFLEGELEEEELGFALVKSNLHSTTTPKQKKKPTNK